MKSSGERKQARKKDMMKRVGLMKRNNGEERIFVRLRERGGQHRKGGRAVLEYKVTVTYCADVYINKAVTLQQSLSEKGGEEEGGQVKGRKQERERTKRRN